MTRSVAAIRFEQEAFDAHAPKVMGRQSAGSGFIRAAVAARAGGPVTGYGPSDQAKTAFAAMVRSIDPTAGADWLTPRQLDDVAEIGVLYRPDPDLAAEARLRLRVGALSYSLCGVTHTLYGADVQQPLADLLREPVAPWDAVICTSSAGHEVVRRIFESELDYLRWRMGGTVEVTPPVLPIIPLGVHVADFEVLDRAQGRSELGLQDDEVVALFFGRLSFIDKSHPAQMLMALQLAAERTGKPLVLLLCGQFPDPAFAKAFETGAALLAPSLKVRFLDGAEDAAVRRAWASADVFVSLADSLQETFGLTPLEAMAAGLPVVVTDWNGYRDTVRDGVDGFRLKTRMLGAGLGEQLAWGYEAGLLNYGAYCGGASSVTSIDVEEAAQKIAELATDPDLRARMGQAARERARTFDWSVVFRRYQDLWDQLAERRQDASAAERERWAVNAPRHSTVGADPLALFDHYPTTGITAASRVGFLPTTTVARFRQMVAHPLYFRSQASAPTVMKLGPRLAAGGHSLAELAQLEGLPLADVAQAVGALAKMGLVKISP